MVSDNSDVIIYKVSSKITRKNTKKKYESQFIKKYQSSSSYTYSI